MTTPRFSTYNFDGFTWVVVDNQNPRGIEFCTCTEIEGETYTPQQRADIVAEALNKHFEAEKTNEST